MRIAIAAAMLLATFAGCLANDSGPVPDADTDGDGLSDSVEAELGLDPTKADSNGDGTADGEEDADGDGYANAVEVDGGSNPQDAVSLPPVSIPGYLYSGPNALGIPEERLFAGPKLYADPQNAPHPAFNWPTLAYPALAADVPRYWQPAGSVEIPTSITDLALVQQTPDVTSGAGTALFGSLAVVPGYGAPTSIVDISDPTDPVVLSTIEPQEGLSNHRGAAFIPYPDGTLVVVISTGSGIDVWDITDPAAPDPLPPIAVSSHKVGVIPGTPIVVNAASNGGSQTDPATSETVTKMWDLSNPRDAVALPDFANGYGCHHVYFWNDVEQQKFRGICAGLEYTQLWNTTDPYNPTVIVSIPFGHGMPGLPSGSASLAAFAHYAGLSVDGKILLVGDESGGGLGPAGCVTRVDTPAGAVSVPNGAVWFYDVSDEMNPVLKGWVSASQLDKANVDNPSNVAGFPASCTAHHGRMIPVPGKDVLAMSFYGAGVVVVDYTTMRSETPGLPSVVAQFADGSDTWETWYYNGYLYTGDLNRGMDILKLV